LGSEVDDPRTKALTHRRIAPDSWAGQGDVGALAGLAGDAGEVGELSKLSRSRVNPAEHVGKQYAGVIGWRASRGSGGMAGGGTGTGDKGSDTLLQATSSSISDSSISTSSHGLAFSLIDDLLVGRGAALFFSAVGGGLRQRGGSGLRAVQRPGVFDLGQRGCEVTHFEALRTNDDQQRGYGGADGGPQVGRAAGKQRSDHAHSPFCIW
jgi:hypothetical protein